MTWVAGCLFVALYDHWRFPPRVCTFPVSSLAEQVPITGFQVEPPAGGVPVEVQTMPHGIAELDRVIVYKRIVRHTTGVQNPLVAQAGHQQRPFVLILACQAGRAVGNDAVSQRRLQAVN